MQIFILNRNEEVVQVLSDSADKTACHFFNSNLVKEINKGSQFTFELDATEGNLEHIKEENFVVIPDGGTFRMLIIKEIVDVHGEEFTKEVFCEDASIELYDEVVLEECKGKHEIKFVLDKLLRNTRWTAGNVTNEYIRNLVEVYKGKTVLDGIHTLIKEYAVEVDFTVEFTGNKITGRKVHIQKAFGRALGKRIEFSKDAVSIKRTVQTGDIKTAIIPFGKTDEKTGETVSIAGITWKKPTNPLNKPYGQTYLEDVEATKVWGYKGATGEKRPRWRVITFENIETPEELIKMAHLQLNRFNKPKVTYEVEALDLYKLSGESEEFAFEKLVLGDLVNIIDHEFKPALILSSRIVKIESDLTDPSNTKITLGNIVETIVDKDLKTQIEELNVKIGAVDSKTDLTDVYDRLEGLEYNTSSGRFEAVNEINNLLFGETVGFHYMEGEQGIWVYDKPKDQNPTKAVAIKGGQIGLAQWDSQLQKWVVGTFIDGNNVNASMITTGFLHGDRIEAGTVKAEAFVLDVKKKIEGAVNSGYVQTQIEAIDGKFSSEISKVTTSVNTKADKSSITELDGKITTKADKTTVYTKEEADSKIKQSVDSINLSVSQTYETKTNVESKITSAVNTVQVGGRNLLLNSAFKDSFTNWSKGDGVTLDTTKKLQNRNSFKVSTSGLPENKYIGAFQTVKNIKAGDKLTISIYALTENKTLIDKGARIEIVYYNGGTRIGSVNKAFTFTANNTWDRFSVTGVAPANTTEVRAYGYVVRNGIVWFNGMQLEKGDKATDWTPAPEDVDSAINTVDGKVDTVSKTVTETNKKVADMKITVDGINTTVSNLSTTVTKNTKVGSFRYVRDWLNGSSANTGNHWCELEVWAGSINIAKGKTPTGSSTITNGHLLTNGNTDFSPYTSMPTGWQWVQIDLGSIRTDVDSIRTFHYWNDARAYNHRLEVSRDGSTWFTIYDSDKMGRYRETSEGRLHVINGTSTETRLKKAEQKITDSAIISTVQSTINQAKNEAISSANNNTDNKLKNYSTTTSMNSAIEQKANSILSTVSNTYTTKGTTSSIQSQINQQANLISTKVDAGHVKSVVEQSADKVRYDFSSSGGYNIVKNGGFKNGLTGWHEGTYLPNGTGRSVFILNDSNEWVLDGTYALCIRSTNNTSGEYRADSQKFKVKRNTTYTLSYLVSAHRLTQMGHYIRGNEWELIDNMRYRPSMGGKNRNNWTRITQTFNTGNNHQISLNFIHFITGNDAYSWVTDVMINEGEMALPWCPHPDEIYNGNTVIDGSGVTINNGALKVKNKSGQTTIEADPSGNLKMNIFGSKFRIAGTGGRGTNMWTDYYDRFILEVPYYQEGSGIWIKRDTGATILVDTARKENPFYKIWIAEMVSPAIKTTQLYVTGSKNCLQETKNYGERLINAYETAEYYFGDIGSGLIKNGECIVMLDDILQECINTDIEYHVFTQAYNGNIEKIERHKTYFIVYGKDDTEFSWELKAKRKGYENVRLDTVDNIQHEKIDDPHILLDKESEENNSLNVENLLLEETEGRI